MRSFSFKKYKKIVAGTFKGFSEDNATKLSGSLAYSSIFSLPPFILIVIATGGYFYGEDAINGKVFDFLNSVVGNDTALQIQDVIKSIHFQEDNYTLTTIIGIVALVIGATGIFTEIQSSLNQIWRIKIISKKGFLKLLLDRLLSFSIIIGLGFLMIISLIADALILSVGHFILKVIPWDSIILIQILNQVFLFFVISFLFAFVFKVLPDVKLKWRDVLPGAMLTSFLFMLGKFLIGVYISNNNMISFYGAAGAVIALLVWIYFSSLILYLGAEFSKAWILSKGIEPELSQYAEKRRFRLW